MSDQENRILSIQSHVVSGYVGNKSATFPLQLLGFEVDAINSVQFSNHTGYEKGVRGQVLDDQQLSELIEGLKMNNLDIYSHIINGYIGSDKFLKQLKTTVTDLKKKNPNLVFVCDPVMGDTGPGWYVPQTLLPIYRDEILPLADVCVPNQFEAQLLSGCSISNETEALAAMKVFHSKGVRIVILSSTDFEKSETEKVKKESVCLASQRLPDGTFETARIVFPTLPVHFVGTGDLFTALTTAWLQHDDFNIVSALEKTIATMQTVLKRTLSYAMSKSGGSDPSPGQLELKLIQSREDILNPNVEIKATRIV